MVVFYIFFFEVHINYKKKSFQRNKDELSINIEFIRKPWDRTMKIKFLRAAKKGLLLVAEPLKGGGGLNRGAPKEKTFF